MPAPTQITVRASADLVIRVKREAEAAGRSMNEWVTYVLELATDPNRASTADERLMARLRGAGLLEEPDPSERDVEPPEAEELAAAALAAAGGRSLAELIVEERRD